MYNLLANETAASLRAFFQNTLPSLTGDWWARHVVNALTFQQQRRVEESRVESHPEIGQTLSDQFVLRLGDELSLNCSIMDACTGGTLTAKNHFYATTQRRNESKRVVNGLEDF